MRVRGVGAATVVAVSRVYRQHGKDRGGRAGPTFPSVVMGERPAREEEGGGICGIFSEGRGHLELADGVRPFHAGHPRVILEVAGCREAGEVTLDVVCMPVGVSLGTIYK